jgi:hypothetical protein
MSERWPSAVVQWFALLGGIAAWFVHLMAAYLLVPNACATGSRTAQYAVTVPLLAAAVASVLVAVRLWRGAGAGRWFRAAGEGRAVARLRFLALVGALLGGIAALSIVANAFGIVLLGPCE